ncbi:MAG TPA: transporter [Terracidiphilus sp.]
MTVTGPGGVITREGGIDDGRDGFSDLYPLATLKWNSGVNNWMIYATGDIPVGMYDSSRLANIGIGHGAIDGGVGYTYFNQQTGNEFSVVTGVTGNFMNPSTGYTNGIDWHLDWGASHFLTKTLQVGAVGYFYDQITADRGAAAFLGSNLSRVAGVGPQIGLIFPGRSTQTYLNFKAYSEFAADNRPSGWSAWVTLSFSPRPPSHETGAAPALTK